MVLCSELAGRLMIKHIIFKSLDALVQPCSLSSMILSTIHVHWLWSDVLNHSSAGHKIKATSGLQRIGPRIYFINIIVWHPNSPHCAYGSKRNMMTWHIVHRSREDVTYQLMPPDDAKSDELDRHNDSTLTKFMLWWLLNIVFCAGIVAENNISISGIPFTAFCQL